MYLPYNIIPKYETKKLIELQEVDKTNPQSY